MVLRRDCSIQCDRSASSCASTTDETPTLSRREKQQPCQISGSRSPPQGTQHRKQRFPSGCSDTQSTSSSLRHQSSPLHLPCQLTKDCPRYLKQYEPFTVFRKPLRRSLSLPEGFSNSDKLQHPDLTEGDREYLRYKAAVYSMGDMKSRVEWRFRQALQHQIDTGSHTRKECQKYFDYLDKPRKNHFAGADPGVWRSPPKITPRPLHFHRRSATAPAGFRSQSSMEVGPRGSQPPARSKSSCSMHVQDSKRNGSVLYYDPATKRTLHGRKKPEPKL